MKAPPAFSTRVAVEHGGKPGGGEFELAARDRGDRDAVAEVQGEGRAAFARRLAELQPQSAARERLDREGAGELLAGDTEREVADHEDVRGTDSAFGDRDRVIAAARAPARGWSR